MKLKINFLVVFFCLYLSLSAFAGMGISEESGWSGSLGIEYSKYETKYDSENYESFKVHGFFKYDRFAFGGRIDKYSTKTLFWRGFLAYKVLDDLSVSGGYETTHLKNKVGGVMDPEFLFGSLWYYPKRGNVNINSEIKYTFSLSDNAKDNVYIYFRPIYSLGRIGAGCQFEYSYNLEDSKDRVWSSYGPVFLAGLGEFWGLEYFGSIKYTYDRTRYKESAFSTQVLRVGVSMKF